MATAPSDIQAIMIKIANGQRVGDREMKRYNQWQNSIRLGSSTSTALDLSPSWAKKPVKPVDPTVAIVANTRIRMMSVRCVVKDRVWEDRAGSRWVLAVRAPVGAQGILAYRGMQPGLGCELASLDNPEASVPVTCQPARGQE